MTSLLLFLSSLFQAAAAVIALFQIKRAGRYRMAWVCITIALALMVQRRAIPFWRHLDGEAANLSDATFGLAVSLLMLTGIWGIRLLFDDLTRKSAELHALAITDALTGLANRREMLRCLQIELERSQRNRSPLTLLMFDIDHFKATNDTWGHAAGDTVLSAIADICLMKLRHIDIAGRWGGEEFLVLLPNTHQNEGIAIAERLRAAIGETSIQTERAKLTCTVSIGVASSEPISDIDALLARVDDALYRAKNTGRNRVVPWRPPSAPSADADRLTTQGA